MSFTIKTSGFRELSRSLDRFAREAKRLSGPTLVPIQAPLDADGYFDRRCPSSKCGAEFKVHWDDYRNLVRDEAAYCVQCGGEAEATDYNPPALLAYMEEVAVAHVASYLGAAARRARLSFRPRAGGRPLPPAATEALIQRTTCASCGCRYATLGSSFFCHSCAHHAAMDTFQATMRTVRGSMRVAARKDLDEDRDVSADVSRDMVENGLNRLVTAYEAYAMQRYVQAAPMRKRPARNAFLNLDRANRLWKPVIRRDYTDILTAAEYDDLKRLLQQRHLMHVGGIVDQDYIDRSGDRTYRVGQRLVVRPAAVARLADVLEKLVAAIEPKRRRGRS